MIAKRPDAILIAPTDKTQLIAPLKAAVDQGIMVITVDTFIDDGKYQDGSGRGDFPMSSSHQITYLVAEWLQERLQIQLEVKVKFMYPTQSQGSQLRIKEKKVSVR